jgi:N6-adenosine-specific RNA methylase IME4
MSERDLLIGDDPVRKATELYGELNEGLHIAGYTFERACSRLITLLEGDAWQLGGRFVNINVFLGSLNLGSLRAPAEQRKRIAQRIRELQPSATLRAIAGAIGAGKSTVHRDVVPSGTAVGGKAAETNGAPRASVPNGTRAFSGEKAAKIIDRKQTASDDRRAKVRADEQRVLALAPMPGKYRTLVIDPAWEYEQSIAGRAKPVYALQTLDQLRTLDLRQWADEIVGCHLYVWATTAFIIDAGNLIIHWGFQYRTLLTWLKPPPFGLGSYFRNSTEHVLFATLGNIRPRSAVASMSTTFEAARGAHSEKPEVFYDIVRMASYPPYGEGNQRAQRQDFVNLFAEVVS